MRIELTTLPKQSGCSTTELQRSFKFHFEPSVRIELTTLPKQSGCSTPELQCSFKFHFEPSVRIELTTPSLPRKCSTPELRRLDQSAVASRKMSGRRGSNSPPIAWKAIALPNELLPLKQCAD